MDLTHLLNIRHPIIQAPMAGVQGSALAIAVSNAGGLGSLPAAMLDLEQLRAELEAIRAQTSHPYSVNFFCHQPEAFDPQREQRWRDQLTPYYHEFGLDPADIKAAPPRQPFNAAMAELLAEFKPPMVSFHFGLPSAELLQQVKSWGAKVISSATTVAEACWLERQGADLIIAQGLEAGGHRGIFLSQDLTTQLGTMALLPQVVAAVDLPVVAAGGIADASGVNAALALGAAGVQLGTSFLLCDEANTSAVHRAALQSDDRRHTALTNVFSGRPARSIVNRLIREQGPISDHTPAFPTAATAVLPLRQKNEADGSGDFTSLWSGQNNSGCRAIPAAAMVQRLAGNDAEDAC
ncbi:MAG: nitronate monooxygenase [Motiliproteus sp.]